MDYNEFAKAMAGYESPNVERNADGTINAEATSTLMLQSVANLAGRIAPIDNADALALAVCYYASLADSPEMRENADRAAEALAGVLELNEQLNQCGEPLERLAAAGRWMAATNALATCRSKK